MPQNHLRLPARFGKIDQSYRAKDTIAIGSSDMLVTRQVFGPEDNSTKQLQRVILCRFMCFWMLLNLVLSGVAPFILGSKALGELIGTRRLFGTSWPGRAEVATHRR
jgi:hypothetical protein